MPLMSTLPLKTSNKSELPPPSSTQLLGSVVSSHCSTTLPVVEIERWEEMSTVVPEQRVISSTPDVDDASTEERLAFVAAKSSWLSLS